MWLLASHSSLHFPFVPLLLTLFLPSILVFFFVLLFSFLFTMNQYLCAYAVFIHKLVNTSVNGGKQHFYHLPFDSPFDCYKKLFEQRGPRFGKDEAFLYVSTACVVTFHFFPPILSHWSITSLAFCLFLSIQLFFFGIFAIRFCYMLMNQQTGLFLDSNGFTTQLVGTMMSLVWDLLSVKWGRWVCYEDAVKTLGSGLCLLSGSVVSVLDVLMCACIPV